MQIDGNVWLHVMLHEGKLVQASVALVTALLLHQKSLWPRLEDTPQIHKVKRQNN